MKKKNSFKETEKKLKKKYWLLPKWLEKIPKVVGSALLFGVLGSALVLMVLGVDQLDHYIGLGISIIVTAMVLMVCAFVDIMGKWWGD